MILVGTDLDLASAGMTSGNLIHYGSYDINGLVRKAMAPNSQPVVDCLFSNSPSLKDPEGSLAPEERNSLEMMVMASYETFDKWVNLEPGERGEAYEEIVFRFQHAVLTTMERYVPHLTEHLEVLEVLTPIDLERRVGLVRGGIYGPELTPDQLGPARFPNGTCGIPGLFLAGSGTKGASVRYSVVSGLQAGSRSIEYLT